MSSRLSIRVLAAALAALWVAMPAVAAVHGAVDAHQYCVEHQAFEHRGGAGEAHVGDEAGDAIGADSEHDSHDDCAFDDALVRDGLQRVAAATERSLPRAVFDVPPCRAEGGSPLAVLATAPKTSPPAA